MPDTATRLLPDSRACTVAKAVYDELHPSAVILFGSRARGDFTPDSDIDLLVITRNRRMNHNEYTLSSAAAHAKADELYGHPVSVDVVHMTEGEFSDCRRARNHVAGQAARYGVDMNGENLLPDDQEPTNWPDIRQRIVNAEREVNALDVLIAGEGPQEAIGFHAQQAVENVLKGWISALDTDYGNTHDIGDLIAIIRTHPEEDDTPAGEQLTWLSSYAVTYRYEGARLHMEDRFGLLSAVTYTVNTIIARIRTLTGTGE